MSQAYSRPFARLYNRRWPPFANHYAPLLRAYYEQTPIGQTNRTLLDVCCGTGQMALHFLSNGYWVTGLDLSAPMLSWAVENCRPYVESGQARFVQADASNFVVDGAYGLAVSLYDALNHLPDLEALAGCFKSVFRVLAPGGCFIFDLNTRLGLRRWNTMSIEETDEYTLIQRGIYDGEGGRAQVLLSGFIRVAEGRYERFEEVAYNTVFKLDDVKQALLDAGWNRIHLARGQDLATPVDDPEQEGRIFFVATT